MFLQNHSSILLGAICAREFSTVGRTHEGERLKKKTSLRDFSEAQAQTAS
jgi:hypothetical protein